MLGTNVAEQATASTMKDEVHVDGGNDEVQIEPTSDTDSDYVVSSSSSDDDNSDDSMEKVVISCSKTNTEEHPEEEEKYIVFKSKLMELFHQCPRCGCATEAKVVNRCGTLVHVEQQCSHCDNNRHWASQPYIGKMPAGNLLLSAAILFSGSHAAKALRMLKIMNVAGIAQSTFYRHQRDYLTPTVISAWEKHQEELLGDLEEWKEELVLAGDARSDSPGHCAKYGSFSVIEQHINKVLDIQLVQVTNLVHHS